MTKNNPHKSKAFTVIYSNNLVLSFHVTVSETYCVTENDSRWEPMCNHVLNKHGSHEKDALLGMEECQSPFGIYEVKMPVNKNLECGGIGITGNNCKDIDVSVYSEILFYER